jgi:predicted ester cyclase
MSSIATIAESFFANCEAGQGWGACKAHCTPDATFAAQAEPLAGVTTLAQYTEWMKGLLTILPDGRYELKSFAVDPERNNVAAYGVFSGTHTGPGGPCAPTGKSTRTDYVYVIQFKGDKISHMTKIWHSAWP